MWDPTDADITAATLEWAEKHGRRRSELLGLTQAESAEVWRMARLHAMKRLVREVFLGERC